MAASKTEVVTDTSSGENARRNADKIIIQELPAGAVRTDPALETIISQSKTLTVIIQSQENEVRHLKELQ